MCAYLRGVAVTGVCAYLRGVAVTGVCAYLRGVAVTKVGVYRSTVCPEGCAAAVVVFTDKDVNYQVSTLDLASQPTSARHHRMAP